LQLELERAVMRIRFLRLQVFYNRISGYLRDRREVGRVTGSIKGVVGVVVLLGIILCALGDILISAADLRWVLLVKVIVLMMRLRFSGLHVLKSKFVILFPERSSLHVGIIVSFLLIYLVTRQLFRRGVARVSGITSVNDSI
jgi:hypothetical protein